MVSFIKKTKEWEITDSLDQDMVNLSKKGLNWGFKSSQDEKGIWFVKKKNDLCKRPFEVVWLYQATCVFVKFKDFGIVKLSWVTYPDEKYKGFFFPNVVSL
jgi:plasmid replication initiation protein